MTKATSSQVWALKTMDHYHLTIFMLRLRVLPFLPYFLRTYSRQLYPHREDGNVKRWLTYVSQRLLRNSWPLSVHCASDEWAAERQEKKFSPTVMTTVCGPQLSPNVSESGSGRTKKGLTTPVWFARRKKGEGYISMYTHRGPCRRHLPGIMICMCRKTRDKNVGRKEIWMRTNRKKRVVKNVG